MGQDIVLVIFLMITAGVGVIWMAIANRRKIRELEHRERLAMIERGIVPAPEVDPLAFERRTGLGTGSVSKTSVRFRSAGVLLVGLGLALTVLISLAADAPNVGLGVGGAFALLGAAFIYNARLTRGEIDYPPPTPMPPAPPFERREPPGNVAP